MLNMDERESLGDGIGENRMVKEEKFRVKKDLKLVAVGDGSVGKTCLLLVYSQNNFPSDYVPTVVDNYQKTVAIGGFNVNLDIFDTAGQEDYDEIRLLSYIGTEVFTVCFAVDDKRSLSNIENKWIKELEENCPDGKRILIGTKGDLREDKETIESMKKEGKNFVTPDEIEKFKKKHKFDAYYETSALKRIGVDEAIEGAIKAVLMKDEKKKKEKGKNGCIIL